LLPYQLGHGICPVHSHYAMYDMQNMHHASTETIFVCCNV